MLQDCPKARREVELHWRASPCANIVRIIDVYENLYQSKKCLLIVMEWWVHSLSTQALIQQRFSFIDGETFWDSIYSLIKIAIF